MEKVMCPYCSCEDTVLAEETEKGNYFSCRRCKEEFLQESKEKSVDAESPEELKPCPFCGVKPSGIVFKTAKGGRPAGYVLEIEHDEQCFIYLSYAYYSKVEYCAKDWNRRK